MKPPPRTFEELMIEALQCLRHLGPTAKPSPRAQLCHFIVSSEQINRSSRHASILLVGLSGVGKSSTINHLFDTGDGVEFAKTNDCESETKNTSEFILTVDEPKYEVSNLQLGIVDTPGFIDTSGVEQDGCNFYSIEQFYKTHPKLSGCYPNLIFLVVQTTDTRIKGPNSRLSKSLRCLQQLRLVDQLHPNVVAILTFCCSVNYQNIAKWEKKMEEKKAIIRSVIFDTLKVSAPVVVLENDYGEDGRNIEVKGDFTVLPNGELQPKNLYNACKEVLQANSDHFGLMTLNACFYKPKGAKSPPTTGHKTEAKNASKENLSAEEEIFVKLVKKAYEGRKNDPITDTAEQFMKEKNLNDDEKEEVEELTRTLRKMGFEDKDACTSIVKGSVEYFHQNEISSTGTELLKKKFGIKKKAVFLDSGDLVGQGYNILTDKPKPAQIMEFVTEEKDFGFVLPICATVEKINQTRSFRKQLKDEKSYVQSRLSNLYVSFDVLRGIFKRRARAGFNRIQNESSSDESSNSRHSTLYEHRMFKVKIENFEGKENEITFTKDFVSDVKDLPGEYKSDDPENIKCFERFFNKFGHFVVSSAYGGGAVERTVTEQSMESGRKKNQATASLSFGTPFGFGAEATCGHSPSSTARSKDLLSQNSIRWHGGSPDLHTVDTLTSPEKMLKWQTSLLVKPTLLDTEMTLEPLSTVISCIDYGKRKASYDALEDLLGDKFQLLASREEEEERRFRDKIKESIFRKESVVNPDLKEWWENLCRIVREQCTAISEFVWDMFE